MKERPILFSTPMVQAILKGRKTQTRRIFKHGISGVEIASIGYTIFTPPEHISMRGKVKFEDDGYSYAEWFVKNRYGQGGDHLWVRECFGWNPGFPDGIAAYYRADPGHEYEDVRWKPSIHMPRIASRITLEVESVRVERLQDISRDDAISEGVYYSEHLQGYCTDDDGRNFHYSDPRISYAKLWCAINGPESWDENPWVWVVEFKRIEGGV